MIFEKKIRLSFIIGAVGAGLFFILSVWLVNYSLLLFSWQTEFFSLADKLKISFSFNQLIEGGFTVGSLLVLIVLSVLFGINLAFLFYYWMSQMRAYRELGADFIGTTFGLLGIGCLACGSAILSFLFGVAVATRFLGFLPFGGLEFSFMGGGFMLLSIYLLVKKIKNPNACRSHH